MYKKIIFTVLILVLSIGLAAASDNVTVDNVTYVTGDFDEVQDAVDSIEDGGIVEVNGTCECYRGPLNIQKSMTLQGTEEGTVFDGCGSTEIISVSNCSVTLKNLKFINTTWNDNAVEAVNSNLTIINCSFDNLGFAVNVEGGSLTVSGCRFSNIEYYAIFTDSGTTRVSDSVFANGGEASVYAKSGDVRVEGCSFKGGDTDWFSVNAKSGRTTIIDCVFDNCGSLSPASMGTISNCTFANVDISVSDSNQFTIKYSRFNKNSQIFAKNALSKVNILNNVFEGNCISEDTYSFSNIKVRNNTIGGYFAKGGDLVLNKAYIKNCQFSNNRIAKDMFAFSPVKEYTITNNVFSNNTCAKILSVEFHEKSTIQVTGNIFALNHDKNGNIAKINIIKAYTENSDGSGFKYLTTTNVGNNFFGFNMLNSYELSVIDYVRYHNSSWINVEFKQVGEDNGTYTYSLSFIDRQGKVFALPNYSFKIQNKRTGEILIDNVNVASGKSTFTYAGKLNLADIFILNDAGGIVNRPEASLTVKRIGSYYDDTEVQATLTYKDAPLKNEKVTFTYADSKSSANAVTSKTNNKGTAILSGIDASQYAYTIKTEFASESFAYKAVTLKNVKVKVKSVVLKVSSLSTTYKSGKTFNVKVIDSAKKPIRNAAVAVKIVNGGKSFTYNVMTDSSGWAHAKVSSYSPLGTFKVIVSCGGNFKAKSVTSKLTLKKAKAVVNVPKSVKKSSKIKLTVKNKASGKADSSVKFKVKVYTGKSFKTYSLKTNSKGSAYISAKGLSLGSHKLVASSNDSRYSISGKRNVKVTK